MAYSRLFPPGSSGLISIPFIPKQVNPNLLHSPSLLLLKDDLLNDLVEIYENEMLLGLHTAEQVTELARQKNKLFWDESIEYGMFVRDEVVDHQSEIALYAVCKDDQKLGEGAFGKVLPVQRLNGSKKGQWFALKILRLQNDQQLYDACREEQTIVELGLAAPSTPRSSRSSASNTQELSGLTTEWPIEVKPRVVRRSASSRGVPIPTSEKEAGMLRSESVRAVVSANTSPNGLKLTRPFAEASSSSASPPVIPTFLSSNYRPKSDSHPTSLTPLKLKKSTEIYKETPPSRPDSPFSIIFSVDDVLSAPGEDEVRVEYDIFMDLINGDSLKTILEQEQIIGVSDVFRLQMAIDIVDALEKLVSSGRLHCDIKPQNIMYDRFSSQAHFIDFGEAKKIDSLTQQCVSASYNGTAIFMAPELRKQARLVVEGKPAQFIANEKTEVYALGMVLTDIFSLHPSWPFEGVGDDDPHVLLECITDEDCSDASLESHILKVIHAATAVDPAQRPSLQQLKVALQRCEQYVAEKEITVGVFDLAAYRDANDDGKAALFEEALNQYMEYFQELWFMQSSNQPIDKMECIRLKRQFEQAGVLVGNYISRGATSEDAQFAIYRHLNGNPGAKTPRGFSSLVVPIEAQRNILDLVP